MKFAITLAAALSMTFALEIRGQLQAVEESSTVEELLKKGIEKIEDDTRIDIE